MNLGAARFEGDGATHLYIVNQAVTCLQYERGQVLPNVLWVSLNSPGGTSRVCAAIRPRLHGDEYHGSIYHVGAWIFV
jgi:hypothetical protein